MPFPKIIIDIMVIRIWLAKPKRTSCGVSIPVSPRASKKTMATTSMRTASAMSKMTSAVRIMRVSRNLGINDYHLLTFARPVDGAQKTILCGRLNARKQRISSPPS